MDDEDADEHIDIMNFHTNKQDLKVGEKYLTKFNLTSNNNKIYQKNLKFQNKIERVKLNPSPNQYLTNDPIYIEDFLLSIRLRFNDVFKKIEGNNKLLEDIQEEDNISNNNFNNNKKKNKLDVNKVIEIQKLFKGYIVRNIDSIKDRLRLRQCLIELFCLLIYGRWTKAELRRYLFLLDKYYKYSKLIYVEELSFRDKISLKLPGCFYTGIKINNLKSNRFGKEQKLKI